jgi:hypothetical protein
MLTNDGGHFNDAVTCLSLTWSDSKASASWRIVTFDPIFPVPISFETRLSLAFLFPNGMKK